MLNAFYLLDGILQGDFEIDKKSTFVCGGAGEIALQVIQSRLWS